MSIIKYHVTIVNFSEEDYQIYQTVENEPWGRG